MFWLTSRSLANDGLCYPVWRSSARIYVSQLHVAGSKCLRIAINATWHVRNKHIHEYLKVPTFDNHVRAQTGGFGWKLAGAGTPYIGNLDDTCDDQRLIELTWGLKTDAAARNKAAKVDITNFAQHFSATLTADYSDFPRLPGYD
jgi:hypothetical protein